MIRWRLRVLERLRCLSIRLSIGILVSSTSPQGQEDPADRVARKKQGGSQALNDNAKSKAVSAGAMLRRYGEAALQEEIRQLMSDWEEDIAMSERVFIRASTHGIKSFVGYEGAVLEKGDARMRVFPFPTRRPVSSPLHLACSSQAYEDRHSRNCCAAGTS